MQSNNLKICLRVNQKWLSKYIEIDGLSSQQVICKIKQRFGLSSDLFYHLYYKNDQNHMISISAKEITVVLKQNRTPKYYLQPTQNNLNHWDVVDSSQTKCDQNFVKRCIGQTKQELVRELASFGKRLEQEVKKQIQVKILTIQSKLLYENSNKATFSGIYCQGSCQNKSFIVGYRFKCFVCPNFNICQKCQSSHHYQHNKSHALIKIRDQEQSLLLVNHKVLKKYINKKAEQKVPKKRVDSQKHFIEVTGSSSQAYEYLRSKYRLATVNELINFYYQENKQRNDKNAHRGA